MSQDLEKIPQETKARLRMQACYMIAKTTLLKVQGEIYKHFKIGGKVDETKSEAELNEFKDKVYAEMLTSCWKRVKF